MTRWGFAPLWRAGVGGGARVVGHVGRGAMVRRGAVTCGPATSQYGDTALVRAAYDGHKDTVELLLDRGAKLEAKGRVSAAAVWCCATGRARRHGRARGDDGDGASGRRGPVAVRRVRRRWRGEMSAGERWCDEVR